MPFMTIPPTPVTVPLRMTFLLPPKITLAPATPLPTLMVELKSKSPLTASMFCVRIAIGPLVLNVCVFGLLLVIPTLSWNPLPEKVNELYLPAGDLR